MRIIWSEEVVEALKETIAQGHTGTGISIEMAKRFPQFAWSRNSIMGKVSRLKIVLKGSRQNYVRKKGKTSEPPAIVLEAVGEAGMGPSYTPLEEIFEAAPPPPGAISQPVSPEGYTLQTLTRWGCRWEVTGFYSQPKDFRFCGAPRLPGKPYCQDHQLRAYVPSKPALRPRPHRART